MQDKLKEFNMLYDLLRRLYLTEPSSRLIEELSMINIAETSETDELSKGLSLISDSIKANKERLNEWIEELAEEYARLFIGPKSPVAVPFASYYLSDNRALMTDETLEVRKIYLEAGLSVQNLYRTPEDQIGIEIEFLYYLTDSMLNNSEPGQYSKLESLYNRFLQEHFKKWVPQFAALVIEGSNQDFYRGAGYILMGITQY